MGLIPNSLTFLNLLCGVQAIHLILGGQWVPASWFILLSVVFDGLDGKIAKWLNQESEFGRFFDAFSDLISFAVAPSLLLYRLADLEANPYLKWVSLLFFLSGFFRLIRFYVSRNEIERYQGLPTTASAAILALEILIFRQWPSLRTVFFYSGAALSCLMISTIPVPNLKNFRFEFLIIKKKT